jgi:hypothetical protein
LKEPIEVWVAGRFRMQDEELGNVVGVQAAERFFEAGEVAGGGLDEEQDFGRGFNFALPKMEVRPGMMLAQAARRSSTRERAMRSASSWEPAVVRMRRTSVAGTIIGAFSGGASNCWLAAS